MVERFVRKDANVNAADPHALGPGAPASGAGRGFSSTPSAEASGGDELHELRVRIPVDLHRQLLSLKVLRGRSLAETVSVALDRYFTEVKASPAASEETREPASIQ